jgi:hypothetical protein
MHISVKSARTKGATLVKEALYTGHVNAAAHTIAHVFSIKVCYSSTKVLVSVYDSLNLCALFSFFSRLLDDIY